MRLVVAVALLGVLVGCAHPRAAARALPTEPDPAVKLTLPWQCITQSADVRDWLMTLRQARSKITVAGAGLRVEFTANPSDIQLADGEPEETLEMLARGAFLDAEDHWHPVTLTVRGPVSHASCVFASEGWDSTATVTALITGRTPEELRRLANPSGDPTRPGRVSLQEFFGLDQTTVEFGSGSFDEKSCKRFGRYWKACRPDAKPFSDRPIGDFPLESDPHL